MKHWLKIIILVTITVSFSGCMHTVKKSSLKSLESFVPVAAADIDFADDLDPASLEAAIDHSINYYENAGRTKIYRIANRLVDARQLKETLTAFRALLRKSDNNADLRKRIAAEFNVYRVNGSDKAGSVLFTGYYEPLLEGSLSRTENINIPFIGCRLI